MNFNKAELEQKTVKQLREIARYLNCHTGDARERANKATLVDWILESSSSAPASPQVQLMKEELTSRPEPAPVVPASSSNSSDLASVLAGAIQEHLQPATVQLDENQVISLIQQHAPKAEPREIQIKVADKPAVKLDRQHKAFDDLLMVSAQGINSMLVGPAGSGKTTAAKNIAKALNRDFASISFGPMTMQSQLLGYEDAHGVYHETLFVKAFRDGGVFLGDEMDAASAAVLVTINMALANGEMATPAGMIKKHQDFVFIAGANTFGTGADRQYVGRAQLDAATLDRFCFIAWDYDETLEANLAGNDVWTAKVREYRRNAENHGLKVVISPRASINGALLLEAGMDQKKVEKMLIFKGLDKQTINKIKGE
jgi:cobaltochelatase CobS